jgi:hypothetical protein
VQLLKTRRLGKRRHSLVHAMDKLTHDTRHQFRRLLTDFLRDVQAGMTGHEERASDILLVLFLVLCWQMED